MCLCNSVIMYAVRCVNVYSTRIVLSYSSHCLFSLPRLSRNKADNVHKIITARVFVHIHTQKTHTTAQTEKKQTKTKQNRIWREKCDEMVRKMLWWSQLDCFHILTYVSTMLSFTLDPIRRDKNEFHTETVLIFLCIHSVYLSVFFSRSNSFYSSLFFD